MDESVLALLTRFEAQLDPAHPTAGIVPVTIIGYGEISAVLKFAERPDLVCKRMAGFVSDAEAEDFRRVLHEYCDLLVARGVDVLQTDSVPLSTAHNGHVVYLVQPAMSAETVGNVVLRTADDGELRLLLRAILRTLLAVYSPNSDTDQPAVAMDAQISNWVWEPRDNGETRLAYIDVGAPFFRRDGREAMNFEPFVRAFPKPLGWYMRRYELEEVIDRYYRMDAVLTDLAGNFIKEQCANRIDLALEEFTAWAAGPAAHLQVRVPTRERVEKYYAGDARIWSSVLALRKLDRFVTARCFGRPYNHILPGKIRRR